MFGPLHNLFLQFVTNVYGRGRRGHAQMQTNKKQQTERQRFTHRQPQHIFSIYHGHKRPIRRLGRYPVDPVSPHLHQYCRSISLSASLSESHPGYVYVPEKCYVRISIVYCSRRVQRMSSSSSVILIHY